MKKTLALVLLLVAAYPAAEAQAGFIRKCIILKALSGNKAQADKAQADKAQADKAQSLNKKNEKRIKMMRKRKRGQ